MLEKPKHRCSNGSTNDPSGAGTKDNLRISQVAFASMAQRGEHQIQMAEALGSMLTRVIFCCWIFCFQKSSDANIAIIANFVCL